MSEFSDDTTRDGVNNGNGDTNVDARLRRSLGARGATPELSPDLITSAQAREVPRLVNRQRRLQAAGGATLAIAAVTVGALVVSLPTQRAPLFLAASSGMSAATGGGAQSSSLKMATDAATSEMRIAPWIDYRYEAGSGLSREAGSGSVYQLKRAGTAESRLRDVAGALGVAGEPTKAMYSDPAYPTWMVGPEDGSAPSVTISWSGTGDWWYNDPTSTPRVVCAAAPVADAADAAGGPAIDVLPACEVPPVPAEASLAPSEAEARAQARALFGKTGLEVSAGDIRVTADPWQTVATANLTVDGTQTALEWTVAWASSGKIAWASGHSIEVVDRGSFGTISATDAVARLSDYRWFGTAGPEFQGGMRIFADGMLRSTDATGSPSGGKEPVPQGVDPRDNPIIEPGPGKTEEPSVDPTAEPVPAPTPVEPAVPPTVEPLPEPPTVEPLPEPLPEPSPEPLPVPEKPKVVVVKVDKATRTLLMMWDAEGDAWLVPGFAMEHPDGWWNTIVSLDDGVIQLPEPSQIEPLETR
ncbi:hypothetical protein [Cryobacterium fucosi]|uniref:Uncharacterized protein n=1 Tax=Cryobacterium fucosi TaxID=1259157 RepID=A0A4R9AZ32_9MICO|nr:hypothetical protein [Cryobacterium fucosi]TFD73273.1 hypothetical protein E3T48_14505 [Cryobacterium fucosi]